jgi:hypothetical protein
LGLSETTVGAVLASAAQAGFKPGIAQGHLRWLYTGGNYMLINGALHSAFGGTGMVPAPVKPEPVAAPAKPARKSKGKK